MEEAINLFKLKVIEILEKNNENISEWESSLTNESIIFAINNKFSPETYVGGLLFWSQHKMTSLKLMQKLFTSILKDIKMKTIS